MTIIQLASTSPAKFQAIADDIQELLPTIQQGEASYGILGLVSRVEDYFKSVIEKRLGLHVVFSKDKSNNYIQNLSVSSKYPVLTLKRRFTLDLINYAKKGDVKPVISRLKDELIHIVKSVRSGTDPFDEQYIIFEVEAPVSTDSMGTLASFRGALPVNKLSLVDTEDADKDYVAKEVKKNHFILKPASDYLREACLKALYNKCLSEEELRNYLQIARTGIYKIIKEHISESANYTYKTLGDRISLSPIRYKRR